MNRLTTALLVAVFAVAACGPGTPALTPAPPTDAATAPTSTPTEAPASSLPAPTPGVSETAAPSAAPSPTPAILTVEEAAAAYKAIAGRYNKVLKAAQKKYRNATSLKANRKFWAIIAAADTKFTADLKALTWPPEVASDIRSMVRANVVVTRSELQASKAKSWSAMNDAVSRINKQDDKVTDLAAIVRDALGLPPNS